VSRGRAGAGAAGYRKQKEGHASRGSAIVRDQPSAVMSPSADGPQPRGPRWLCVDTHEGPPRLAATVDVIGATQERTNRDVLSVPHRADRRGPGPLVSVALLVFPALTNAMIRARLGAH